MNDTALQSYRRQRLQAAVNRLTGGNVTAFGRLVGYQDGAFVRQMISGDRAVSEKTVRAIEELRGMDGWFAAPVGSVQAGASEPAATYRAPREGGGDLSVYIPVVKLFLKPGEPGFTCTPESDTGQNSKEASAACFPASWLRHRGYRIGQLIAVRMHDESMRPSLQVQDIVTIHTGMTDPQEGGVYLANEEGGWIIRRLVRDKSAWWLVADNPIRYPRKQLVSPALLLLGKVIHVGSESI